MKRGGHTHPEEDITGPRQKRRELYESCDSGPSLSGCKRVTSHARTTALTSRRAIIISVTCACVCARAPVCACARPLGRVCVTIRE